MVVEIGDEIPSPPWAELGSCAAQANGRHPASGGCGGKHAFMQKVARCPRVAHANAGERLVRRHDRPLHLLPGSNQCGRRREPVVRSCGIAYVQLADARW
ncbi:hypothetical protein ACFC0C_39055 [Streptomyces sp. NPDC056178]|uniref:hypothetical protein n=1 Tax=Streptomyces sp. NPDC056178 TaxID=3345735 RepID=UPI0035D91AFE